MYDYPELTHARGDMQKQSEYYRPTTFWDEASSRIVTEICTHGVERFRSLPGALSFFVSTYGTPFNGFSDEQSHELLDYIRERKQLRKNGSAGVETPILSDDYLVMLPEYELVERNIFPFGYQTVDNFHSELLLLRRKC